MAAESESPLGPGSRLSPTVWQLQRRRPRRRLVPGRAVPSLRLGPSGPVSGSAAAGGRGGLTARPGSPTRTPPARRRSHGHGRRNPRRRPGRVRRRRHGHGGCHSVMDVTRAAVGPPPPPPPPPPGVRAGLPLHWQDAREPLRIQQE